MNNLEGSSSRYRSVSTSTPASRRFGPTKYEGVTGTRWTYTALGPAVNLAARIARLAEGGTILVGPETERRIEETFVNGKSNQ